MYIAANIFFDQSHYDDRDNVDLAFVERDFKNY